jgi:hypothetical protein
MAKKKIAIWQTENIELHRIALAVHDHAVRAKKVFPELNPQEVYDRIVRGTPRRCYVILETERTSETAEGQFIPCVAEEGTIGYYKTDWTWGNDIATAREIADDMNEKMGISKNEAHWIVAQSMRKVV